jgi:hypothetical protein
MAVVDWKYKAHNRAQWKVLTYLLIDEWKERSFSGDILFIGDVEDLIYQKAASPDQENQCFVNS